MLRKIKFRIILVSVSKKNKGNLQAMQNDNWAIFKHIIQDYSISIGQ